MILGAFVAIALHPVGMKVYERLRSMLSAAGFQEAIPSTWNHLDVPLQFEATFRKPDKSLWVDITANECHSEQGRKTEMFGWRPNGRPQNAFSYGPDQTPSGATLGDHVQFDGDEYPHGRPTRAEFHSRAVADRFSISVDVGMSRTAIPANFAERSRKVRLLCEALTRRILGEAMAIDLSDDGSPRASAHLMGMESNKSGFVPLSSWAQAHHVTPSYDTARELATFTYQGRAVVLPLASKYALISGRREELRGKFIMARGDRWFVPSQELSEAVG